VVGDGCSSDRSAFRLPEDELRVAGLPSIDDDLVDDSWTGNTGTGDDWMGRDWLGNDLPNDDSLTGPPANCAVIHFAESKLAPALADEVPAAVLEANVSLAILDSPTAVSSETSGSAPDDSAPASAVLIPRDDNIDCHRD